MTITQIAIISNALLGAFDLVLALLIITPDKRNPNMTPVSFYIVRFSFFVIFACEGGRHLHLALRSVYGVMTPSQSTWLAIGFNVAQLLVIPLIFYVGLQIKRGALWEAIAPEPETDEDQRDES